MTRSERAALKHATGHLIDAVFELARKYPMLDRLHAAALFCSVAFTVAVEPRRPERVRCIGALYGRFHALVTALERGSDDPPPVASLAHFRRRKTRLE